MKSIFASKTFWGAAVTMLAQFTPQIFVWFGVTPDVTATWAVSATGFALAVYGRYKATKAVSVSGK